MNISLGLASAQPSPRNRLWFVRARTMVFALAVLLIVGATWCWGAREVRGVPGAVCFLTVVGIVWLILSSNLFFWFGLSHYEDIIERRNPAALAALAGAILALGLIYAGGQLGEGPTYAENFFSAGIGTLGFFALWLMLEVGGRISVSIAEERDFGTGLRVGGFFLAVGLIFGRALTGDWHSPSATVRDFLHDGWPALVLICFAGLAEWKFRPTRECPFPPWRARGLGCAIGYVIFALVWVLHLGRWEGMPK